MDVMLVVKLEVHLVSKKVFAKVVLMVDWMDL